MGNMRSLALKYMSRTILTFQFNTLPCSELDQLLSKSHVRGNSIYKELMHTVPPQGGILSVSYFIVNILLG